VKVEISRTKMGGDESSGTWTSKRGYHKFAVGIEITEFKSRGEQDKARETLWKWIEEKVFSNPKMIESLEKALEDQI